MNIEMALKSRSIFLILIVLSWPWDFFLLLSCLMEILFLPAFRIYLYFCQKHTPKSRKFNVSPNFMCGKGSLVVP